MKVKPLDTLLHGIYLPILSAGFVQGDFTLSNIVIDGDDRAKIIDINRRGCPVGWEPPEVAALIDSKQRISMYIGVKSDIFQLGMVLWAIAMEQDEPEIQPRPLTLAAAPNGIPSYYRAIVAICLSDDPRNRCHATALLGMFPDVEEEDMVHPYSNRIAIPDHVETQYIDPETAVGRDDIDNFRVLSSQSSDGAGHGRSSATHTYVNAPTDMSGEPYYYPTRGRSPPYASLHDIDRTPLESFNDQLRQVITVAHRGLERDLRQRPLDNGVVGNIESPRDTEAAPGLIPEDLAGIGEHSTLHSDFPQVLDDDLTTDMP
jgi:hypothetical protein